MSASPERHPAGHVLPGTRDGAFVRWNPLTGDAEADPFGVRSLFRAGDTFAPSPALPSDTTSSDPVGLHRYLVFGCCVGERTPVAGVTRVPCDGGPALEAVADPRWGDFEAAKRELRRLVREAVARRLPGGPVGLLLSGGLDSGAVAVALRECGADVRAFTLDLGPANPERDDALATARHLGLPVTVVPVDGPAVFGVLPELAAALGLPFADGVTGPLWHLCGAARAAGLDTVFNGEFGDQLFGGWTNKPMLAAGVYGAEPREAAYLRSFHKFAGLERDFYTPEFLERIGEHLDCTPLLAPLVRTGRAASFLHRMRLTDIEVKGRYNILPRMHAIAAGHGLTAWAPLADRELAGFAFALPTGHQLHGAREKHILREAFRDALPPAILDRPKTGMGVPVTDWLRDAPAGWLAAMLGPAGFGGRGLFRQDELDRMAAGENEAHEVRRRRLGERLWALVMLEAWLRHREGRR